jgi:sulfur carrier protein ThiS
MTVRITLLPEKTTKRIKAKPGMDGFGLLKELSINPENVIILRNDRPIPVDGKIGPDDELKVIRVVSGG